MINFKKFALMAMIPISASAGGFQINTQGVKSLAMGSTFVGVGNDASTVFFNPGGMSLLSKSMFTAGTTFIMPKASYLSPYSGNIDMEKQTFTPIQLYGVYKLNNLSVGLSVNNPYGLGSKWADDWEGRYVSQEVALATFYIQPSVGYQFNDKIGIGAGFVFATGHATVRRAAQPINDDINVKLEGGGNGVGYNIGVFVKPNDKISVGLCYRSGVNVKLKDGDATLTGIPTSLSSTLPASTTFTSELDLPSVISFGVSYKIKSNIMVTAGYDFTGWNSYDSLNFLFPDHPELDSRNERNYKSTGAIRIGAQYTLKEKIDIRAGFSTDKSPVQDGFVSPELPDADKSAISLGAGYRINDKLSVDLAYVYESLKERQGTYKDANFSGSYKTIINAFAIGINYSLK
ncbi:MAG: outer membrane protein transport protein [Bacteroidetes bacterium]|nr:outer membrane protein transport protein [Bacteroidota bacterium]